MNKSGLAGTRLHLRVTGAAESIIRSGHPWLFAESIREQNREGLLGELAVIYQRHDQFLAIGLFDPDSPIRVRILHTGKPQTIDRDWWFAHLQSGLARRTGLFHAETNGYRCLNGESDGWPGLVLDRYGQTLVLKLYTASWLPRLEDIMGVIRESLRSERIVLRLSRNIQELAASRFSRPDGSVLLGAPLVRPVEFLETGLRFEADVLRGQKTGFFLDQRENRRRVEPLARGSAVLNAFSFSGGFSLYAARGGACSVTDLDISLHALESARRNFSLNRSDPCVSACRHEAIHADAFEWLGANRRQKFDVIILDPPSLAKRESERQRALLAYHRLVTMGLKHLNQRGTLVACSCSAHVSPEEFFKCVQTAADEAKRQPKEFLSAGHPPDHPATFREAQYLKAAFLRF